MNNLILYLKELEIYEKIKLKINRRNERIKIRVEINDVENNLIEKN